MPDTDKSANNHEEPVIRRRQALSRRRRDGLIRFASDTTSQNGEDGIIARIFECLPQCDQRYCVDVGAWDGRHLSNSYSLLTKNQEQACCWKGLLVEADPSRFVELSALHSPRGNTCVNAAVSISPGSPNRLENVIQQHATHFPLDIDFLCVDIDGSDYWVLDGLWRETKYRPKLVCIEFNPTMPDDLIYIPPKNDSIRHGGSLSALVELAEEFQYVLVETTLFNAFFIPKHLYQDYLVTEVPDTSIEALHEITMGTSLYQLYDGTLKVWGCKKLLWHRTAIDEKKLQMLPPERRQFPFAPTNEPSFDMGRVVNMSPWLGNSSSSLRAQECADELLEQLGSDGFVYVRGTGISHDICHEALQLTQAFLTDADESVRRYCLTKDRARRGYSPMCTENFASLIGEQGPNDLVRKFRIGPTATTTTTNSSNEADENNEFTSSLWQPNMWPTNESWDPDLATSFQKTLEDYYKVACEAADSIVEAISDAVRRKHPEILQSMDVFSAKDTAFAHTSILTLLGYRVGTRHKGKKKSPLVAAHTDVGVITMLLFDGPGCAQLQRSDGADGWVDVCLPASIPDDPVFVVNVGDCMSELTSNKIPSTLHRVVVDNKSKDPRHCLALFMGLDPRAPLTIEDETMTYEEWRKRRIARSQEVLNAASESK